MKLSIFIASLALAIASTALAEENAANAQKRDGTSTTTTSTTERSGTVSDSSGGESGVAGPSAKNDANKNSETTSLTDDQIAAIVVTANTADIENGKLAQSKTKNSQVKELAQHMINDHTASNKQATQLAAKLKMKPKEGVASHQLKTDAQRGKKELEAKNGEEFDKAYVDGEIALHQKVLDSIDKQLLPNAKNAELKDLLTKTRPVIVSHLEHAKMLKSNWDKKK